MDKWKRQIWSLCILTLVFAGFSRIEGGGGHGSVAYDGRSLIVNGHRKILFSASIHYPRSTPDMWPSLIAKAKEGGVDVIQTYVFWNLHEPHQGQYDFSGRRDIVRFIKEIQAQGLYATLRIGPFIEAEWSHGGLPVWLRDIPNIVFRSDNEPFKLQMEKFTRKIVNMMKEENLYASQGGPIILSQIENEYTLVEPAFHEKGPPYVRWAANMSVSLETGVPWVMCRQDDAPDPMINACNGMRCGQTFAGPNSPNKPSIWTENWTSFYQAFGEEPYMRSAEDIAFQVALFIAKNGSYVNYYMYHGGTNFGRTGSAFVTTSYYDQAPLDEYGLIREPKWGHLKELHAAIKLCSKTLLSGTQTTLQLGKQQEAHVFQDKARDCAAFLVNNENRDVRIQYQNNTYDLPKESISILPDCKTVVFNTAKVSTQYGSRAITSSKKLDSKAEWEEYKEIIPSFEETSIRANTLLEQVNMTKDKSDYLWYTFRYNHNSPDTQLKLDVSSRSHALLAYVNGDFAGASHGSIKNRGFSLIKTIKLRKGTNNISLLSVMTGLPDGGAYLERRVAGLRRVKIQGKYFSYPWGYQVGLLGEHSQIYKNHGSSDPRWSMLGSSDHQPLTWYKTSFDAPDGNDPVAVNLGSMGKGEAWVNGESLGKYWVSFLTSKGNPSQTWYHIPRSFLKPKGNVLVLLEEEEGNPVDISVDTISIAKVCGRVSDSHYPPVGSWVDRHVDGKKLRNHKQGRRPKVQLSCPSTKKISKILFASFGDPAGNCEKYATGKCHSSKSRAIVEKACLGKTQCTIPVWGKKFGDDPCPGTSKALMVDAVCT